MADHLHVSFAGIPASAGNLEIAIAGQTSASTNQPVRCSFSGDTTSGHYTFTINNGFPTNSFNSNAYNSSNTAFYFGNLVTSASSNLIPGIIDATIQNYAGTTFYKGVWGSDDYWISGSSYMSWEAYSGVWKNTGAVTSMSCALDSGNFVAKTAFTLSAR